MPGPREPSATSLRPGHFQWRLHDPRHRLERPWVVELGHKSRSRGTPLRSKRITLRGPLPDWRMPAACRRARNTSCTAIVREDLLGRISSSSENSTLLIPGYQRDFVKNDVRNRAERLTANNASRKKRNDGKGNGIEDRCESQEQRFVNTDEAAQETARCKNLLNGSNVHCCDERPQNRVDHAPKMKRHEVDDVVAGKRSKPERREQ